jgi:DNA sulfur modification protein DndD
MIITQLVINNFGIYRGRHEFDLKPKEVSGQVLPVVLFGGKNGSGKTTVLEAIRLCLHGRLSLGGRVRKEEYDQYLKRKIHQHPTVASNLNAQVGLQFEHVHAGIQSIYKATRSWRTDGAAINERIAITKDGMPFYDVMEEHWDDFLRDLIPPGVADLFFFDGEKIQALADDNRDSETLKSAVRGLLNLDLIDRLQADLSHYLRQQKKGEKSISLAQSEHIQTQYDDLIEQLAELRQDRAQLLTKHDYLSNQLERYRTSLVSEGALFIRNRDEIEKRLGTLTEEINHLRDTLRTSVAGLVPFAIAPQWVNRVGERLRAERMIEQQGIRHEVQNRLVQDVLSLLKRPETMKDAKLTKAHLSKLEDIIVKNFGSNDDVNVFNEIRHPLSETDRESLLGWIYDIQHGVPMVLIETSKKLINLEEEERRLVQMLKQIPADQIGDPLIEGFNHSAQELGKVNSEMGLLDERIRLKENELAQCERERLATLQKIAEIGDDDMRIDRALKVQLILAKYLERITDQKLKQLEFALAEKFNLLIRKHMLIREVKVDRDNFVVTLYGPNRVELPKTILSAGEKQMYATALLWALRLISGRALPIVIDTPMGRLDSDHRTTLLDKFLPLAAHQVVILSTDTEINNESFVRLKPAISHTYVLNYNQEQGCTEVSNGYFAISNAEV